MAKVKTAEAPVEKTIVTEDAVISKSKGLVKFYAQDGSIQSLKSKEVRIVPEGWTPEQDEANAAVDEALTVEAPAGSDTEIAEQNAEHAEMQTEAEGEPAPSASPKLKRALKTGAKTVASKKKAAKKKAPAKKPSGDGSLIRTVAGREHDISGYEKVRNASGAMSYDNGDKVATTLRGKTLDEAYDIVAKKVGETAKSLRDKYKNLNAGMQRMNLGNRLRKVMTPKKAEAA